MVPVLTLLLTCYVAVVFVTLIFSLATGRKDLKGPVSSGLSCSLSNLTLLLLSPSGYCSSHTVCLLVFCVPPSPHCKHTLALRPFHLLLSQLEIIFLLRKASPWPLFNPLPPLIFLCNTYEMT